MPPEDKIRQTFGMTEDMKRWKELVEASGLLEAAVEFSGCRSSHEMRHAHPLRTRAWDKLHDMAASKPDQVSFLKDEYIDVSNNLRHWNTLRFAELTVFMALTAGLINAMYIGKGAQSFEAGLLLKCAGIFSTLAFFVLQERTMTWFHAFNRRAIELEKELGFRQYMDVPRVRVLSGQNSIRSLFMMILAFWILMIVRQPL
ncbi:MAG: hypothetical protein HND42_07715 [Armatimonadetes bacterium]|nr:hypothetical protein [Armatimonadota bacterium]